MKSNLLLFTIITLIITGLSYYLFLQAFSTASFILYGSASTIPLYSALVIEIVAGITLFTSELWVPAVKRLIVDMYTIDEKRDDTD